MAQPSREFLNNAVYLIDASSYIFRAYYGIHANLTAPDGTPTHATYGFLQMIQALIETHKVSECALLWDQKSKGVRHEYFPEYKANRGEPPEDLSLQLENSKVGVQHLGFPQYEAVGYEADDIIATIVEKFPNKNFVIVTGDKDLLQLVNDRVWCLDTLKNKWSNHDAAVDKFGVEPALVPQVQALCGDSVDNIPGAPGIGPKTASALMQSFGDLDSILKLAQERYESQEKIKDKTDPLRGKKIENIAENIDQVKMSLKLVTLIKDVPIDMDEKSFEISDVNIAELEKFAKELGLEKLLDKIRAKKEKLIDGEKSGDESTDTSQQKSAPEAPKFKLIRIKSTDEFKKLLNENKKASAVAIDTETFGLIHSDAGIGIVGLCLAFDTQTGYYLPFAHETEGELSQENLDTKECLALLDHYLRDSNTQAKIVFQNAKFDLHVLAKQSFFVDPARIEDTMILSYVLNPAAKHGMDALAQQHLDYTTKSFKEVLGKAKSFAEVPLEEATQYAAEDAVVTLSLFEKLKAKLAEDENLTAVYERLDRGLAFVLFEMEEAGVCLETNVLSELSKTFHKECEILEKQATDSLKADGVDLPEDFNLGSPKQIAKVLFEDLGLPVIKKGKTGPSTDVSVMEALAERHAFPKLLLEVREIKKLLSTYIDAFPELLNEETGRLHTEFSQTVAVTGRLASSHPNLQNIPIRTERGRKIRAAFTVPEGSSMLGIDYSQVELRILADISEDKELCKAFHEGADIHKRTAALVLGVEENKVSSDDRRMAKAINFGIVYGQTPFGLSKALGIDRKTAKKFIDDYFATYPGIKEYMDKTLEAARTDLCVRSLSGRVRYLPDIKSKNVMQRNFAERTAINTPIQGSAADLIKAAMLRISEEVMPEFPEAKMILQIHDELLFEVPDSIDKDAFESAIKERMEDPSLLQPMMPRAFTVPMKAEGGWGRHWGELK